MSSCSGTVIRCRTAACCRRQQAAKRQYANCTPRYASLTWSVPVSNGYGRRMRFLVFDASNDKLMGLLALGDPVYNLRVRDQWIGWSVEQKNARLWHVMDAYVLDLCLRTIICCAAS